MGKLIAGYGISHDAGVAIVDANTGYPTFACSLERLTRLKNHVGMPLALSAWAKKECGSCLLEGWQFVNLLDDHFFKSENGFHAFEGPPTTPHSYRWTAERVTLKFDKNDAPIAIGLGLLASTDCLRRFSAKVYINGNEVGLISNFNKGLSFFSNTGDKNLWLYEAKKDEIIHELCLEALDPQRVPQDSRILGVMISHLFLKLSKNNKETKISGHAISEISSLGLAARLVVRQVKHHLPGNDIRSKTSDHFRSEVKSALGRRFKQGVKSQFESRVPASILKVSSRNDHHLCHLATAYWPSGFNRALVVSLDGMGDDYSCRIARGEQGALYMVKAYGWQELPIGMCYAFVTGCLGFIPARHEGKITGLASYGKENAACRAALDNWMEDIFRKRGLSNGSYNMHEYMTFGKLGQKRLRDARNERLGEFSREDIAYAIQAKTEDETLALIQEYQTKFPDLKKIALAGGVFANVKLNQRVKEMGFEEIFIQPAMSDAGLSYGAALLEAARQNGGRLKPYRLKNVMLGPGWSREEIEQALCDANLAAEFPDGEEAICQRIAELLAAKKVVAHFDGRMEYGPRALGNRSILYAADDPDVNRWLNERLNRTEFMPFAPAIMAERAPNYFHNLKGAEYTAEFMTITFDCSEKAKQDIPAAVHIDGTARPQLVSKERLPRFYGILKAYDNITGIPSVINTSFNMHEEPIVATPQDAIRAFQLGQLDVLVLGHAIVHSNAWSVS